MSDLVKRLRQAGDDIAEAVRERYGFDEFDSLEHQAADRIEELEEQLQITKLIKDSKIQEVTELEAEVSALNAELDGRKEQPLIDEIAELEAENRRLQELHLKRTRLTEKLQARLDAVEFSWLEEYAGHCAPEAIHQLRMILEKTYEG